MVDNTASITPFVPLIVQAVEQIATRLKDSPFKPEVSFALVLYRDHVPAILFKEDGGPGSVVKVFPFQSDLDSFLATVRPLKAATSSSEDLPEAVSDGVHAGLTRSSWRGGALSNRVVILIGDNSAHEPGHPKNPNNYSAEQLTSLAVRQGVRIFGQCVQGEGGPNERRLHQEQWEALARGTRGFSYPLDESARVVDRINEILDIRVREVANREEYLATRREGKSHEQVPLTEEDRCAVVEFFRSAGVDPERLGPGVPTFATGWCLTEVRGRPLLRKKVFIARAELDLLMSELNTLNGLLGAPAGVRRAMEVAVSSRIDPTSFFARRPGEAPHETLDVFLQKKGIPSHQGLLKLTREEVEHMPEECRAHLRDRLSKTVLPSLLAARKDDRVFTWLGDMEFGWVEDSLFP